MTLIDKNERARALNVNESFIVQAPAGSGKTELLIQRFLKLLLVVEKVPEECLAITFTRKAAHEMKHRILSALSRAQSDGVPESEHERFTWDLAKKVIERDKAHHWGLLNNPSRLNIQTVDALCGRLTRMMPVTSKFGASTNIAEDSERLYYQAALGLIDTAQTQDSLHDPFSILLLHLDNQLELVKELLANMLKSREQWLGHIISHQRLGNLKEHLETGLRQLSNHLLKALMLQQPESEAPHLIKYAAENLLAMGETHSVTRCVDLEGWPGAELNDILLWQSIADCLLTKTGEVRKTVTKAQGFYTTPDKSLALDKSELKQKKELMISELDMLRNRTDFVELLNKVRRIPPVHYHAKQWKMLKSLFSLLPQLVAELHWVFSKEKVVDYTEIALAADSALGEFEQPSDLALALDYQIRHILVDEFQDTSLIQYRLLKKLTQSWELNDNRSLFLVGDPQQSIYRFRQADVGLYLTVKDYGINDIPLTPLLLKANFRSQPKLVRYFNTLFKASFPTIAYAESGAVPYSPATPVIEEKENASFQVLAKTLATPNDEANKVVEVIQSVHKEWPEASVAILVRARGHLKSILPALSKAGISYRGVDIELLSDKPVVRDLFSLTKAILHLNDRISWLSLLRSPYVGFTLNDCYTLTENEQHSNLWGALQCQESRSKLSEHAKKAIERLVPLMNKALSQLGTKPIVQVVSELWDGLGGEHCYKDLAAKQDAESFFALLATVENEQLLYSVDYLEKKLEGLFAEPKPQMGKSAVEVMTVHRSKGLEYDVVLLPGLDKVPNRPQEKLLTWETVADEDGQEQFIFAPMKSSAETSDLIYHYLQETEKEREYHESVRLFYVAATRAKRQLYLFGYMAAEKPRKNSFLNLIWQVPELMSEVVTIEQGEKVVDDEKVIIPQTFERLPLTQPFTEVQWINPHSQYHQNLLKKKTWQSGVGEAIHRLLWRMSLSDLSERQTELKYNQAYWIQLLRRYQVPESKISEGLTVIEKSLKQTLSCPKGRWILDSKSHELSESEWALQVPSGHKIKKIVIDRTFVEDNIRWIIDYKVNLSGEKLDEKDIIERHRGQLTEYVAAVKQMEPTREIKAAIYYPLESHWVEI